MTSQLPGIYPSSADSVTPTPWAERNTDLTSPRRLPAHRWSVWRSRCHGNRRHASPGRQPEWRRYVGTWQPCGCRWTAADIPPGHERTRPWPSMEGLKPWRHHMETISSLLTLCEGNPEGDPSVTSGSQRNSWIPLTNMVVMRSFTLSLFLVSGSCGTNSRVIW